MNYTGRTSYPKDHSPDPHRRTADDEQADAIMARTEQRHRNAQEWINRAMASLRVGAVAVAEAQIAQAKLEYPEGVAHEMGLQTKAPTNPFYGVPLGNARSQKR